MYFEFHHGRKHSWTPSVDVCERGAEIVIFVEMAGVDRADVQLSWHEGVLTISGHKREHSEPDVSCYHCVERSYGQFRRDIAINIPIEQSLARAELRDGLMSIYLPKRTTKPESSSIPIE